MGTGEALGGDTEQSQPCDQFIWSSPYRPGLCFGRARILPTTFVTLSAGHQFVTAIDRDGAVWAWGDAASGELGVAVDDPSVGLCDPSTFPPALCALKPQLVF